VQGALVRVAGVAHRYPAPDGGGHVTALDGVTLSVAPGESLAVVGSSGAGKSTLLRILSGATRPTSGTVSLDGADLGALSRRERSKRLRRVATVPRDAELASELSVLGNVMTLPSTACLRAPSLSRAEEALAAVGLEDRAHCLVHELSSGEQRRLAVAHAIASHPRLLLADEPTCGLDPFAARALLGVVWQARERFGTTLVVATHDPLVARSCERVIRLHDGRLCV
jgi:putative ABC transport system ATP-binding protein